MKAISSMTMQILWNDVPSQKFTPSRGIKQGCPLLLYLFVLCVEWLGHIIHAEIAKGQWSPIRLARSRPDLSHLFFVDDLVLFCRAKLDQAHLLAGILNTFYVISSHKVSLRKSNIFFSKGVDTGLSNQINQMLGFSRCLEPWSVLGCSSTA